MKIEDTDLNYYEVGGSVRDRLMDREPTDRDFVIVGHTVDEVVDAGLEQVVGEDFPVFLDDEGKECAMARTEEKVSDGHHGFEIQTSPEVGLEEDLARRDLTINAMALDPEGIWSRDSSTSVPFRLDDGTEIIDPFEGRFDIRNEIIRHTTEAFTEDPLRILRAARFAARFDFDVADETVELCRSIASRLTNISEERIAQEVIKTFKQAEEPSAFFHVLDDMDALNEVLPELKSLQGVPAGPEEHHAEGDAFKHTMMVLDEAPATVRCRFAALAHDLGKARTPEEKWPNHYGHDAEGVHVAERLANRLKLSNELQGVMMDAAEQHMRFMRLDEMSYGKVIELVERLDRSSTHINPGELIELCDADGRGRKPSTPIPMEKQYELRTLIVDARMTIDLIGGEEVLKLHEEKNPGEWVGERIHQLRVETLREARENNAGVPKSVEEAFPFMGYVEALKNVRDFEDITTEVNDD